MPSRAPRIEASARCRRDPIVVIECETATWTDVKSHVDAGHTTAFLPFGALEQHGPHLPLATDTIQCGAIARRLTTEFDGLLLAPVHYGETWNNAGYPGTVSLSPETVTAICIDIARSVWAFGVRGLVVVNGDFGNCAPLAVAARRLAEDDGISVLIVDYPGLTEVGDEVKETAWAAPGLCHADEIETSMVLSISPELVHPDRYVAEYPDFPADFGTRPMQLHPFSPSGVFGDPRPATAAKGERILDAVVSNAVNDVRAYLDRVGST